MRRGGERLELEKYQNKNIYHNYGHGMWGINLGPISSKKII